MCWQDPAVATSKRVGNASYEAYDRGTEKNAWVFNSDGTTPLLGQVGRRRLDVPAARGHLLRNYNRIQSAGLSCNGRFQP